MNEMTEFHGNRCMTSQNCSYTDCIFYLFAPINKWSFLVTQNKNLEFLRNLTHHYARMEDYRLYIRNFFPILYIMYLESISL